MSSKTASGYCLVVLTDSLASALAAEFITSGQQRVMLASRHLCWLDPPPSELAFNRG